MEIEDAVAVSTVNIELLADGSIEWRTPRGRRIDGALSTGSGSGSGSGSAGVLVLASAFHGIGVSAQPCDSRWDGLPAGDDRVLAAFFSRPVARLPTSA